MGQVNTDTWAEEVKRFNNVAELVCLKQQQSLYLKTYIELIPAA